MATPDSAPTIKQLLRHAQATIDSDSPRLDAEVLLAHVLQKDRTYLFTWPEKTLTEEQAEQFQALLQQRQQGLPVAHLIGQREFWGLPLAVDNSTLIPRPDTETLVEVALQLPLPDNTRALDLGTGTGAIALALASEKPSWTLLGVDRSPEAVALAQHNAAALGLGNATLRQSDWFSAVTGQNFDLIVSNPPYIDEDDPHLAEGDVRFEPQTALVAANHGLADLELIVGCAPDFLGAGGWLLLEHGYQQGGAVRELLRARGFEQVATHRDLGDQERVSLGCWPGSGEKSDER
ncbi:peptide chain release factor N(5)-glutamine methyltransferase [Pseudomaricurvus sp. HS19]|uniref:peptide chain release factor N(5)-glutamine methyltransferase n=1 Tax=Pseudomaricurvus sp. HS19 TaxID=2692626 RepID=UPI00136B4707|nr:peptide chain release factor N(5)-glutamine methyltransferase [Pseudomaricurvus sp. HS19]MYM63217.1 peptide chain release factor N(5)-glutamine methyltransferase [Pseudomaricurvus sp. HS19]